MIDIEHARRATDTVLEALKINGWDAYRDDGHLSRGEGSAQPAGLFRTHGGAVHFWREFVRAGGLALDRQLWHVDGGAESVIAAAVELGIVNGWDGPKTAMRFVHSREGRTVMRVGLLHPLPGDPDFGREVCDFGQVIERFFVRELNRAHCGASVVAGLADRAELDALLL